MSAKEQSFEHWLAALMELLECATQELVRIRDTAKKQRLREAEEKERIKQGSLSF